MRPLPERPIAEAHETEAELAAVLDLLWRRLHGIHEQEVTRTAARLRQASGETRAAAEALSITILRAEAPLGHRRAVTRVPPAPSAHHQSFSASHREKSASARAALNRVSGLHLAAALLCRGVDAPRPASDLEKENVDAFSQWPCQAQ